MKINRKYLLVSLKYIGKSRNPVICKIQRISKPGLRVYSNAKQLPKVLDNLGIAIISLKIRLDLQVLPRLRVFP